jgi:hypothetical protein
VGQFSVNSTAAFGEEVKLYVRVDLAKIIFVEEVIRNHHSLVIVGQQDVMRRGTGTRV